MTKIRVNCKKINAIQQPYYILKVTSIESPSKICKIQGYVLESHPW